MRSPLLGEFFVTEIDCHGQSRTPVPTRLIQPLVFRINYRLRYPLDGFMKIASFHRHRRSRAIKIMPLPSHACTSEVMALFLLVVGVCRRVVGLSYTNFLKFLKVKETFYKKFPCGGMGQSPKRSQITSRICNNPSCSL